MRFLQFLALLRSSSVSFRKEGDENRKDWNKRIFSRHFFYLGSLRFHLEI